MQTPSPFNAIFLPAFPTSFNYLKIGKSRLFFRQQQNKFGPNVIIPTKNTDFNPTASSFAIYQKKKITRISDELLLLLLFFF